MSAGAAMTTSRHIQNHFTVTMHHLLSLAKSSSDIDSLSAMLSSLLFPADAAAAVILESFAWCCCFEADFGSDFEELEGAADGDLVTISPLPIRLCLFSADPTTSAPADDDDEASPASMDFRLIKKLEPAADVEDAPAPAPPPEGRSRAQGDFGRWPPACTPAAPPPLLLAELLLPLTAPDPALLGDVTKGLASTFSRMLL